MNCPHCGVAIVPVTNWVKKAEAKYREDVKKAHAAILVLGRVPYPELWDAAHSERARLLAAIEDPAALYAIYRRADKKTPIAYGMVTT
jgi:hypothetical protein